MFGPASIAGVSRCWLPVSVCVVATLAALIAPAAGQGERRAAARATQTVDASLFQELQWRNIGPIRGGRSIAVGGSAARPNEYYFGATGGGLWKTSNGGTDWAPVTDQQISSSSVGAIEVCPSNPDVVYIGMGEVQFRGNVIPGDGIYKTTDGGETWTHLPLVEDAQTSIGRIRVDSGNCDRVFAAVLGHNFGANDERGLFRSTDGGETWENVLFQNDLAGAVDVSLDPDNPDVVYAGFWHAYRRPWLLNSGGAGSGLFKSTDGGDTWENLTDNPGMPAAPIGKVTVSVSGADSSRVYAMVEAAEGGLFASDDAGATWRRVNANRIIRQRAFYFSRVYADPVDRDTVYVLNVQFWKSTNGGATISQISAPHVDHHDLWIAPNDNRRMINGNDGGANVSTNGGQTWTAQDFSTSQMYHVTTTNDTPYLVCGAQQDNDTACLPHNGDGTSFFEVGGGESGYIAVDPEETEVFYAGSYGGYLSRFDRRTEQTRNINIWPDNPMGHPARDLKERFHWTFPIMTTPLRPDAVYASSQHLFVTTNEGQSWRRLSPDLTRADPDTLGDSGGPITKDQTSIEYFANIFSVGLSPLDRNVIWAGSDDGLIHVTRNHGRSWERVTPPLIPRYVRMSIIDPGRHDPGTAYVAAHNYKQDDFSPYLFRTTDYGRTWRKITRGIPDGHFAWSIREDPVRPGLLFAGTEHGVYVSFDSGANWQSLQLNMPDLSIQDVTIKDDDLIVNSHGRGFYVLEDIAPLRQITPEVLERDYLFEPPTTELPVDTGVTVDYYLRRQAQSAALEFVGLGGQVIERRDVSAARGLHRVSWEPPENVPNRVEVRLIVDGERVQTRIARIERVRITIDEQDMQADPLRGPDYWEEQQWKTGKAAPAPTTTTATATATATAAKAPSRRVRAQAAQAGDGPVDLLDPSDPIRRLNPLEVFYNVREPVASVTLTFLDRRDRVVRTITGLTGAQGLQRVQVGSLRYPGPVSFPGLIYWAASTTNGPLAPWGDYRVRLTAGGDQDEEAFTIRKDPRLTEIRQRDIEEQFQLATRIVARTSDANSAVIRIRSCKTQIDQRIAAGDAEVGRAGAALKDTLSRVEEAIYQVRLQSGQDPLNFPIKLNNKIAALLGVVESAEDQPTDQTYEVFDLLSGELQTELDELAAIVQRDVPAFNELMEEKGLPPIEC
jgi:photosystem II stability/assembly factor-like uncharacterized protein